MRKNIAFILVIIIFSLSFQNYNTAAKELNTTYTTTGKVTETDYISGKLNSRRYVLGPNDIISISVFNEPELSQDKIRIQPDGKIILALVGPVNVSGLTVEKLYELLMNKYGEYIRKPQITLNLVQTRSFIVYVSGAVTTPGSYELDTNLDSSNYNPDGNTYNMIERKSPLLSNILIAAGGVKYDADLENVEISNKYDNSKIKVNLLELLEKEGASKDVYLIEGDTVYVPELPTPFAVDSKNYKLYASATFSPKNIQVRVLGYVNNPGLVQLDTKHGINLNSAVAAAGGYLKDSAYIPEYIYLSRADNNGKLITTALNPMNKDVMLFPNDIVYVPEKIRPLTGKAFDYMTRVLIPINTFANTYNNWALMFEPLRFQNTQDTQR